MPRVLVPFARFNFGADEPIRHYGEARSPLESKGQSIGPNDLLIAAHALALSAMLVTNNVKEFKRGKGLKCEDWAMWQAAGSGSRALAVEAFRPSSTAT